MNEVVSQHSSESVSPDQPSSVDVFRGFCALRDVTSYIVDCRSSASDTDGHTQLSEVDNDRASDGQVLPTKLASAGRHTSSIVLPVFRLEVMEDIFSLLFSRVEHLRDPENSPDRQTDSEPENCDGVVVDPKRPEFAFDVAELSIRGESTPGVVDAAATVRETSPAEKSRVGILTAESRSSPLEVSSSSHDGRSDELSGSQTVSNSSMQCGTESGFLVQDYVIRGVLLLLHNCCEELSGELTAKLLSVDDVNSMASDRQSAGLESTVLRQRIAVLQQHVSDARWRLRIATAPSARISPLSEHHEPQQRRQRSRRHRDSVTRKDSDSYSATSDHAPTENTVVPRMLCRPESLLNLCLVEGRIVDAEEVVKVHSMHC